jgi:hypothetical protein
MRVRVLIFGALKDRLGSAAAAIELPKNATVADLPGRAGASRTAPQMPQAPRGMAESMNAEFATTAQLEPGTARGKSSHLPAHAAILGLALAALLAPPFTAQETTLRVDVRLVNIFVNVTDENGSIVGGLGRDDFAVTEDGRPQQIAVFERQSELPLNLTLAIDTSGSVHKDMAQEACAHRTR